MKPASLLLAASLVANAALALVVATSRPELRARWFSSVDRTAIARTPAPATSTAAAVRENIDPQTWARLSAGDLSATVAQLQAEGFPSGLLRLLVEHLVSEQFAGRRKALAAQEFAGPWWQRSMYEPVRDPKLLALRRELAREEREAVARLLGPNPPVSDLERAWQIRQYGNLPPEKIAGLERLNADYRDMMEAIRAEARDIILPEEREKLAFLEAEKQKDIAKLLSPDELFEHEIRGSVTARRLRDQLALFQPTEEEFRAMFTVTNAVESKYGGGRLQNLTAAERRERNQALRQLPAQMQGVLTPERFAAYQLAIDPAYRQTRDFVAAQALPSAAAADLVAVQKDTTARLTAIRTDRTLPPEQRNAQLASLAAETNAKLTATLGEKGLAAYRQGAGAWLNQVQPPAPPARPTP